MTGMQGSGGRRDAVHLGARPTDTEWLLSGGDEIGDSEQTSNYSTAVSLNRPNCISCTAAVVKYDGKST